LWRRSPAQPEPDPTQGPASHWGTFGPSFREALAFYGQFISVGDLVFDVGANVGNRTEVFLELGAYVVAFEPQPPCAERLGSDFGANPRFTLVQAALGSAPGTGQLFLASAHVLASTSSEFMEATTASGRFSPEDGWRGEQIEVQVSTLDAAIERFGRPVFVKVDVEGAEPNVLEASPRRCQPSPSSSPGSSSITWPNASIASKNWAPIGMPSRVVSRLPSNRGRRRRG
jgi:FkbM family methyltransferase